jgi:ribonuclease Z
MTTQVILTGTGVPYPSPNRAGAGTLVRHGDTVLQFDAGRGTVLRLVEADIQLAQLTALFVTHVHSDHVASIPDVTMTRWAQSQVVACPPLPIIAPEDAPARFVEHMLDPYVDDLAVRRTHTGNVAPDFTLSPFAPTSTPETVWTNENGSVEVSAVAVHHEPVDAVAYRVRTPDGSVVISGDTRVCQEVEDLAGGANVLVHEACRATALGEHVKGTIFETIFSYHADTVALGGLAERAGVAHLVLTHLIPAPGSDHDVAAFAADTRSGGYTGTVTVGEDLTTVTF